MPFWTVSTGKTGKGDNGENKPWMSYCYGGWLPRVWWNGGRPWRGETLDIGWYWLFFHGHFTRWQGTNNRRPPSTTRPTK